MPVGVLQIECPSYRHQRPYLLGVVGHNEKFCSQTVLYRKILPGGPDKLLEPLLCKGLAVLAGQFGSQHDRRLFRASQFQAQLRDAAICIIREIY